MSISPLFAIDAQKMLGAGDASGAVHLLEEGIAVYPEYATAYAVLARSYMQMRDVESAYEWVRRGLGRFPTHRALAILEKDLRPQTFAGTDTEQRTASDATYSASTSQERGSTTPAVPSAEVKNAAVDSDQPQPLSPSPSAVNADAVMQTHTDASSAEDMIGAKSDERDSEDSAEETIAPNVDSDAQTKNNAEEDDDQEVREMAETTTPLSEEPTRSEDELLDDALSNVDDDNDAWNGARELVDDIHRDMPSENEEAKAQLPAANEQEQLLDDALSNIDDDNDEWTDIREVVADRDIHVPIETVSGDNKEDADAPAPLDTESVLQKINVVGGNVVMDRVVMKDVMGRPEVQRLKVVNTAGRGTKSTLRSSAMRLIPGLEFTPLRVQSGPTTLRRSLSSIEYPPFPVIRGSSMNISPALVPAPLKESTLKASAKEYAKENSKRSRADRKARTGEAPRTQLEELAQRLERVRTPMTEEPDSLSVRAADAASEPSMVTETMANIYVQQGAVEQAIKAYTQLARMKPERREEFEQRIRELQSARTT